MTVSVQLTAADILLLDTLTAWGFNDGTEIQSPPRHLIGDFYSVCVSNIKMKFVNMF